MRDATKGSPHLHKILRLPRKMNLMMDPFHTWKIIYNALCNKSQPLTSPNTPPATENDTHNWSCSHMKRHLQYAEPIKSNTMRGITSVILQLHQILRLPRKMSLRINPALIWNVIYHAWSNSTHLPTSPKNAPATENDTHDWSYSHIKRYLQCAEQQHSPSNLTKYCACHAKWHSKIWRKSTENGWSVIYNARPTMIRAWNCKTEPACSWSLLFSLDNAFNFVLKITTFHTLAIYPNFTKYCAWHEKSQSTKTKSGAYYEQWHSEITKYCACHEKWHSNITKCCACHEKWQCNITKYCACHEEWQNCYFPELLLCWILAVLSCYFTDQFLYYF